MTKALAGKVAVITGGARGMGQATALRFLTEGARVVVADLDRDAGEETLAMARAEGLEHIRFIPTDVALEQDVAAAVDLAVTEFGGIDIMFSNAGIPGVRGPLTETKVDGFDRTIAVNLRGTFLALKHAGLVLKRQGRGGSMIATSSDSAFVNVNAPPVYGTSKVAIVRLVKEFASELGPYGIRVNDIAPGAILTPMYGGDLEGKWRPVLKTCQPLPITGEPSDIAEMALFLASDASRFVTGASMLVDGGAMADGGHMFMDAMKQLRPTS